MTQTDSASGSTSYGHNAANQLCWSATGSIADHSCATVPTGATRLSYDANGNETSATGVRTSAYNARNQLASVTLAGGSVKARAYAGPGQAERISASGLTLRDSVLGLFQAGTTYFEREESGRPHSQRDGSTRHWFVTDSLGSVRGLLASNGTLAGRSDYTPYGQRLGTSTGPASRLGFAGGELDDAGLYHFGQRYYDPERLRWTQVDPIDQAADVAESNRYAYVAGNPVSYKDLSGGSAQGRCRGRRLLPSGRVTPCASADPTPGGVTRKGVCKTASLIGVLLPYGRVASTVGRALGVAGLIGC